LFLHGRSTAFLRLTIILTIFYRLQKRRASVPTTSHQKEALISYVLIEYVGEVSKFSELVAKCVDIVQATGYNYRARVIIVTR
jgi:hypothetical protein